MLSKMPFPPFVKLCGDQPPFFKGKVKAPFPGFFLKPGRDGGLRKKHGDAVAGEWEGEWVGVTEGDEDHSQRR